jgi:A/G-specific adenine glycosylase
MPNQHPISQDVINWFSANQRDLPWRANPEPYPIWLCEIMMQQTRIETGTAYWHAFLERWPTVADLARADEDDVLKAWQGLGYYSRARNLLKAARLIVSSHGGEFPNTSAALRKLPGIGPYTAAAIGSICFGESVAAVDGNVIRVVSRLFDIDLAMDSPAGKRTIEQAAETLVPSHRPGDHNQGMMEIGALICKPKNPACGVCPLQVHCASRAAGTAEQRPVKHGKMTVKEVAMPFVVLTDGLKVAMVQRPKPGIWAGLWTFPLAADVHENLGKPNGPAAPAFTHILTHRRLHLSFELRGWSGPVGDPSEGLGDDWRWVSWSEAEELAMPRAMEKIWSHAAKSAAKVYI